MTKMNSKNGNETKSDILSQDKFKSEVIFPWSEKTYMLNFKC